MTTFDQCAGCASPACIFHGECLFPKVEDIPERPVLANGHSEVVNPDLARTLPETARRWAQLKEAWLRYWALAFLGWALMSHQKQVVETMHEAMRETRP